MIPCKRDGLTCSNFAKYSIIQNQGRLNSDELLPSMEALLSSWDNKDFFNSCLHQSITKIAFERGQRRRFGVGVIIVGTFLLAWKSAMTEQAIAPPENLETPQTQAIQQLGGAKQRDYVGLRLDGSA